MCAVNKWSQELVKCYGIKVHYIVIVIIYNTIGNDKLKEVKVCLDFGDPSHEFQSNETGF